MAHHVSFVPPEAFKGLTLRYTDTYLTPYGPTFIAACAREIVFWGFCSQAEAGRLRDALERKWHNSAWHPAPETVGALAERARVAPARLALAGTPFQHRVWQKLLDIPPGQVASYKQLADALGSAPRAIGGAVGANPVSLLVPCHRVLGTGKSLNGYRWGLGVKARILAAEGAAFQPA
jgi:AraC family transcriptional regulator of adaptative response/methylated-DNA-[protein]-cysteine methyltransferase